MLPELTHANTDKPMNLDLTEVSAITDPGLGVIRLYLKGSDKCFEVRADRKEILKLVNEAQGDPSYVARLLDHLQEKIRTLEENAALDRQALKAAEAKLAETDALATQLLNNETAACKAMGLIKDVIEQNQGRIKDLEDNTLSIKELAGEVGIEAHNQREAADRAAAAEEEEEL